MSKSEEPTEGNRPPSYANIKRITDDYLQLIEEELDKEPVKPKKTKAQKRKERKEAKRLQDIEDKKLIMRDNLRRELELGKRMEQRGTDEWEQMCKQIKLTELQEELSQWGERADRLIKNKNDHIHMLLDDIQQNHELQMQTFSKTVEMIDHITDCFKTLVASVKQMYESQAEEIIRDFHRRMQLHMDEVEHMHNQSENVVLALNLTTREQLRTGYKIYVEKRDDRINTEIEKRFTIRDQMVNKMASMHSQLIEFVDLLRNTELDALKYKRIRMLTERQEAFMEDSRKLGVEEIKHLNAISAWHKEIVRLELENNAAINDLRMEYKYFYHLRQKIQAQSEEDRIITRDKLRVLTTEAFNLIKFYEDLAKKGNLLLALSLTCRKLQTQEEKIVLGGEIIDNYPVDEKDENFVIESINLKEHLDISEKDFQAQNKLFKHFWRRHAMVLKQNLMLEEEKHCLTEDNNRYCQIIKGLSKTSEVEELRTAISVKPCEGMPKPVLFDTACRDYRPKAEYESSSDLSEITIDADLIPENLRYKFAKKKRASENKI